MRGRHLTLLAGTLLLAACSATNDEAPVVEYPTDPPVPTPGADGGEASDGAAPRDGGADAPEPVVGTKLLSDPVFIESVTSDGHLVFTAGADLDVWPVGAAAPVTLVKDYDSEFDSFTVRGRLVFAWLGESPSPSAVTTWTAASGVKPSGPVTRRLAVYPRPSADTFAYLGPAGASALLTKVSVTQPGQGAGTVLVPLLDSGLLDKPCKPTITWANADLLVAGCTGGSTTPRVATYATDGTGATHAILEGSAPGVWLNHARSRVLVQTATQASLRAVSGAAAPLVLDTPVVQAAFSADDAKVVYLRADGALRRATTATSTAPVDLGTAASMLAISPDARFTVLATTVDTSSGRSDVVVVDANAPGTRRTLAPAKAIFLGLTKDGASVVYQTTTGLGAEGPLLVAPLAGGPTVEIARDAERVVFDGAVVYWQEFVAAQKTNVLKAARIKAPSAVLTLDQGLDPLTAFAVLAGPKLFVGSKLGLWSYPSLAP